MHYETINNASERYPFLIEHQNVKYIPHFHKELELVYVLDGVLEVTIGDNAFSLSKGEICVITSELIHNLYSLKNNRSFVIKIFPYPKLDDIILKSCVIKPSDKIYPSLKTDIESIIKEDKKKELGYELAVNACVQSILLLILRDMEYLCAERNVKTKLASQNRFLSTVSSFLEGRYSEELSLDDVARHFNFTKSYFCHYFKKITGVTFWKYYTIMRLEKSVALMKEHPEKTFMEISGLSGFKNVRAFNLAFKEYYNCTPREYKSSVLHISFPY